MQMNEQRVKTKLTEANFCVFQLRTQQNDQVICGLKVSRNNNLERGFWGYNNAYV